MIDSRTADTQSSDKRNTEGPTRLPLIFPSYIVQCIYVYVDIPLKFSNKPVEHLDDVCWEKTPWASQAINAVCAVMDSISAIPSLCVAPPSSWPEYSIISPLNSRVLPDWVHLASLIPMISSVVVHFRWNLDVFTCLKHGSYLPWSNVDRPVWEKVCLLWGFQ